MSTTTTLPFRAVVLRHRGFDPAAVAAACGMTLAQAEAIPTGAKPIGTRQRDDKATSVFDRMLVTLRRSRRDYTMAPVSLPVVPGVWPTEATDLKRVRPVAALALGVDAGAQEAREMSDDTQQKFNYGNAVKRPRIQGRAA
jgi:hypothetical protein